MNHTLAEEFDSLDKSLNDSPNNHGGLSADEIGSQLDNFRPYLLMIAMSELPEVLRGKVGASDVVQETLFKGIENYGQFRGTSKEELAGWLRAILVNLMANYVAAYRSHKRDVMLEVPIDARVACEGDSPSGCACRFEQQQDLEAALAKLSDLYREVILLRHREGLSFGEIGLRTERSEEAARKIWIRALNQLRQELSRNDSATD